MHLKIIKTEADYETALSRVDDLMSAEPGTLEFDELEVMSLLVERYETDNHPIELPTPLEAIEFRMDQAGLKQRDLIPYIGSSSKVSEVLAGKRPLTLAMMKALHRGLGIPAEVFFREASASKQASGIDAARLPWGEIVKRGWIANFGGTARQAKARPDELLGKMFHPMAERCMEPAMFRRSIRTKGEMDEHAVTAWMARVVTLACQQALPVTYEHGVIDEKFMSGLVRLSFLNDGPRLAQEYLTKHGIHLVIERHLPRTRIDGAATCLPDGTPVIGMSLRHDRLDNFWFTLAHELGHLALHLGGESLWFIDDLTEDGGPTHEQEADEWAMSSFIPAEVWHERGSIRTESEVRALALELSISPAIIAGRIRHEQSNYRLLTDLVGQRQVRHFFGY